LIHFGVTVLDGKYGLKLTRENYATISNRSSFGIKFSSDIYADEQGKIYKDEWCEQHFNNCMKNYDLNIRFFSQLSRKKFRDELYDFLTKNNRFVEVTDLSLFSGKSGYYILVIDEYCQLYIGTTKDIKRRIQNHWSKKMPFDRLLFPMGAVNKSILSIDSFRALDTTRIFAYVTNKIYEYEDNYLKQFSQEFICDRMAGGEITGGLLQAITMMKSRSF
jgi:hypothetical protein